MSPTDQNACLDEALAKCHPALLNEDDETIGYTLLEDVSIDLTTCFYEKTMARVRDAGLIDEEIYQRLVDIKRGFTQLTRQSWDDAAMIRQDPRWLEWLRLCDHARQLKAAYAARRNS